jgi:hypothetical protein
MTPRLRFQAPRMADEFTPRPTPSHLLPLVPRTRSRGGLTFEWAYAPELKDERPTRKAAPFDIAPSAEEPGRKRKYADRVCEDCHAEYAPAASNQKRCLACTRQAKAIQRKRANEAKAEATRVKREQLVAAYLGTQTTVLTPRGAQRRATQEIDAATRERARRGVLSSARQQRKSA